MSKIFNCTFLLLFLCVSLFAQEEEELNLEAYQALVDSIENSYTYQTGSISLLNGDATIEVPSGFKFLDKKQSEQVLTEIWGNPPSEVEGMLFPKETSPVSDNFSYAVEVSYSDDGYIEDEDAREIDYDELLEGMQSDAKDSNPARREAGYPGIEIVGWASPPYYDEGTKKLHWAKELKFDGEEINTLNYNIRILGRSGYLNLNAIGDMEVLPAFKKDVNEILRSVHFTEGNMYKDFDSSVDKIAAYGIGGLIAGKVLAKAGILAKFGIILAKFWKIIALGVVAFGAGIKNMFFGKREEEGHQQQESHADEE